MPTQVTDSTPILQAKRRARDYGGADGLPTIFDGLCWLLFASFFIYVVRTHHWMLALCTLLPLFLMLIFCGDAVVEKLRTRITYPRTGYVRPPEPDMPPSLISLSITREPTPEEAEAQNLQQGSKLDLVTKILGMLFLISLSWLYTSAIFGGSSRPGWIVLILVAMNRLAQSRKDKLAWIDVIGLISAGFAIAALPIGVRDRIIFMFATPGVLITLRGTLTLLYYLFRNPLPRS
jgi:hypothetical protein